MDLQSRGAMPSGRPAASLPVGRFAPYGDPGSSLRPEHRYPGLLPGLFGRAGHLLDHRPHRPPSSRHALAAAAIAEQGRTGLVSPAGTATGRGTVEISVVMPCLNEVASVGTCVRKALAGLAAAGLDGEVIVVDNGSTDGSAAVARSVGARVLVEPRRGYGNAYLAGFEAARGRYLVMGDADDSYDFSEISLLVEPLRAGRADYVLGSRFIGKIMPGAMPWSHRYLGNPLLTGMLNRFFGLASSDAHSGMRAFTRVAYERMRPRCGGMELASELIILAARVGLRVEEVPITYHPRVGTSKLRMFRDGWRHVRFMLLLAPRHLFVAPGLILLALGVTGQFVLLPGVLDAGFHRFGVQLCVLFAMAAVLGWQAVLLGVFADTYNRGLGRAGRPRGLLAWAHRRFTLERGLAAGCVLFVIGLLAGTVVFGHCLAAGLGPVNEPRPALLAMTLMVLGAQSIFASFFLQLLIVGCPGPDAVRRK
ncbi:glycosyltransferase family 2 protein [Frankia sp. CiP3]|uniref:glycosyltransferase family 2 protein n=1 Tax=Frankia sp. CiP3 TaxID=2880971 RepID=UPI001EF64085|nr:glycosyltransferase family 2 protein [Frankia sp. CiP3]